MESTALGQLAAIMVTRACAMNPSALALALASGLAPLGDFSASLLAGEAGIRAKLSLAVFLHLGACHSACAAHPKRASYRVGATTG